MIEIQTEETGFSIFKNKIGVVSHEGVVGHTRPGHVAEGSTR